MNDVRVEVDSPESDLAGLRVTFVPPAGSTARTITLPIPLSGAGMAETAPGGGIPLDVPGAWTLQVSATTPTGAVNNAGGRFDVRAADGSLSDLPTSATTPGRPAPSTPATHDQAAARRTAARTAPAVRRAQPADDLVEGDRVGDLELVVAAARRLAVGPPADERHAVAEPAVLELPERDLGDERVVGGRADRDPRQVLAGVPPARRAGLAADVLLLPLGPVLPRVPLHGVRRPRLELGQQLAAELHGEPGGHADVLQAVLVVVQAEQQRTDALPSLWMR